MRTSLLTLPSAASAAARAGIKRLGGVWFTLVQTAVASGLAWYIARDVLDHPQPFFAPIAAAVSLSISNVLRTQRAIQMMIGVTLGIGVGTLVEGLLGPGAIAITVAALIALVAAVFIGHGYIGQGMMFANQTVVSAILVLALYRSNVGSERIADGLIGGALAIVFAIVLFPADPVQVLGNARTGVLEVLQGVLSRTASVAAGRNEVPPDWPHSAVDRLHEKLGGLIEARTTARQVVRLAPRRWRLRRAVQGADHQALHVALLAGSVLQLARAVVPADAPAVGCSGELPPSIRAALAELAKATSLADADPAAATAHIAVARHHASELHSDAGEKTDVVLANVVGACIDDLHRVIELRQI